MVERKAKLTLHGNFHVPKVKLNGWIPLRKREGII
jgi:hypothetical protein